MLSTRLLSLTPPVMSTAAMWGPALEPWAADSPSSRSVREASHATNARSDLTAPSSPSVLSSPPEARMTWRLLCQYCNPL